MLEGPLAFNIRVARPAVAAVITVAAAAVTSVREEAAALLVAEPGSRC
jgi:hypothetical protein